MKRTCPACSATFIKGVRVLFAARHGAYKTTVCPACASKALRIVQDKSHAAELCTCCDKRAAVFCSVCSVPRGKP